MKFNDNSCLLLIDLQKDYNDLHNKDLLKNVSKLLKQAREEKRLICFIFKVDKKTKSYYFPFSQELRGPKTFDKGIPFDETRPLPYERTIIKNGYDSFFETSLHEFLKQHKVKNLYISGCLTGICVLNTIFSAFNKGYRIYLIENACSDRIKKRHNDVITNYSNYLFIKETI